MRIPEAFLFAAALVSVTWTEPAAGQTLTCPDALMRAANTQRRQEGETIIRASCKVGETINLPGNEVFLIRRLCDLSKAAPAAGGYVFCVLGARKPD